MKRTHAFLLLLPFLWMWPACSGGGAGSAAVYPRTIVPAPEGGGAHTPLSTLSDSESESYLQRPKIDLAYDEKLLQVLTANLDADDANEQLIVAKGASGEYAPLKLIIADFDYARNGYVRSWETGIGALDERTIRLAAKDVIGNHALQLIASGMTRANQASLSVWKIVSQSSGRLAYAPIFRLESDVSVEVQESDRGVGYAEGYANGASFPIVVFSRDPAAADVSSIVRDTFSYSPAAQSYILARHETVMVEKATTDQLSALLRNGSPELLKRYLQGLWYKEEGEAGKNDRKMLTINTETGEIAFYSEDIQEVYYWKYTRRSLFNTLHMYTESALLKSVQPNITAVLESPAALSIEITEYSTMEQWLNEQWGGKYVKLGEPPSATRDRKAAERARAAETLLKGAYVSQTGVRASFSYPVFTWNEDGASHAGGFYVLEIEDGDTARLLLSLKVISDQGLAVTDKFYTMDVKPAYAEGASVEAFTLKPAQTTVYGVVILKGQPLAFTRPKP